MKKRVNIIKTITVPVEIDAEDMIDAVKQLWAMIPNLDTDSGKVEYSFDFSQENG